MVGAMLIVLMMQKMMVVMIHDGGVDNCIGVYASSGNDADCADGKSKVAPSEGTADNGNSNDDDCSNVDGSVS